ncbi:hypothetical protein [Mediterraneibacter massiliensis]|uniref:hypothetical protein n=1 Tax=Mediterraneibacter massiliensis TaxID=1720300 RepID=UPI000E527A90|nr:hypothetical protein [Mediterraneibacter massiliensis]RGT71527.1 hypothetical protein DWX08_13215 [Ruminococcus sp. AF18-22]
MRLVKGVTAGFLTLTMALSLMPQIVFAEETTDSHLQYDVTQEISREKTEEYDVTQEDGETDPEEQDVTQESSEEKAEALKSEAIGTEEKAQNPPVAYSAKSNTVASWGDLKTAIEGASADTTISISGRIVKSSSDERITIPAGVEITLAGTDAVIVRPSTSDVGEFYVGDNGRLTL